MTTASDLTHARPRRAWCSYEAYVLYEFFVLLTQFCDGEDNLIDILVEKPELAHPWPLCCLPTFSMGRYVRAAARPIQPSPLTDPNVLGGSFSLSLTHDLLQSILCVVQAMRVAVRDRQADLGVRDLDSRLRQGLQRRIFLPGLGLSVGHDR